MRRRRRRRAGVEMNDGVSPNPGTLGPALTLAWRELIRFVRQRSRVASALLQPVIIFVFFGAALNGSFKPPKGTELSYSEYLFPGTLAMIVMFTAIFATI